MRHRYTGTLYACLVLSGLYRGHCLAGQSGVKLGSFFCFFFCMYIISIWDQDCLIHRNWQTLICDLYEHRDRTI